MPVIENPWRNFDAFDPSAAPVVTAGAELALGPTAAPQGLSHDLLPLLPGRILDQNGFHISFLYGFSLVCPNLLFPATVICLPDYKKLYHK